MHADCHTPATRKAALSVAALLCCGVAMAQEPLAPCNGWLATVDSLSQLITLSWQVNPDSRVEGYFLCTGSPCLDYDSLHSRLDTTYICLDHSPLEPHTYRLHAFDADRQPGSLTPPFGNMVLRAEVPECSQHVHTAWNIYPNDDLTPPRYTLQALFEPADTTFSILYSTYDSTALSYDFDLPDAVTAVSLRVAATLADGRTSHSNIVRTPRLTADTALAVDIEAAEYDSVHTAVVLTLRVDPRFDYVLFRSVDGSPWRELGEIVPADTHATFTDRGINPYDSLHCYQLQVFDACGQNPHYSATTCLVVPDPPAPNAFFPNAIVAGDEANGRFLPAMQGLKGDLYDLWVYGRDGRLVYHTADDHAGWTPSASTPAGVYAYTLRCRFNDNTIRTFSGTVTDIK